MRARRVPAEEAGTAGRVVRIRRKTAFDAPSASCRKTREAWESPRSVASVGSKPMPADLARSAGFFRSCRLSGAYRRKGLRAQPPGRARGLRRAGSALDGTRSAGRGRAGGGIAGCRGADSPPVGPAVACVRHASRGRSAKKPLGGRNSAEVPLTHLTGLGIYPALFYRILDRQIQQPFVAGVPQAGNPSDAVRPRALDFRLALPLGW